MRRLYPVISFCFAVFLAPGLRAQCPISVDAGPDVSICLPPMGAELNGSIDGDYLNFNWSPTTGLTFANTLTPGITATQNMTYVLTASAIDESTNLILNGDFESGNTGFTSSYLFNPGDLWPEGFYDVIDNPQSDHPNFSPCPDHTTGNGQMMVINGTGTPNQEVWCQSVPVQPNTQYAFSSWVTSVVNSSPALLQFSINGVNLGTVFSAPGTPCAWQQFYTLWNSGSSSSADICLINQNTQLSGNDFAIDDIVFSPTCKVTDTVRVTVASVVAVAAPANVVIPCENAEVTLSGLGSSTGAGYSYFWETFNGNIISGENTLNPVVAGPGTYTLTVMFDNNGVICEKSVNVNVTLGNNNLSAWVSPVQPIGCGGATTNLVGNANFPNVSWEWNTFDGFILSGWNDKIAVAAQAGTYTLTVTNNMNGCTAETTVQVTEATNPPTANANAGSISCLQMQAPLSGSGSSTGPGIVYQWTTIGGVIGSGFNSLNAVANAPGTYILQVTNNNNQCVATDTVQVTGSLTPPAPAVNSPGALTCTADTLTLAATLSPANATFTWTVANGGHIAGGGNTLMPQIDAPGTYTLSAVNPANSCTAMASITVPQNIATPTATIQTPDSITCQTPNQTLSAGGSSSGANFVTHWTAAGGGNIVSGDSTLSPVINAPGVYTLLITNTTNGCTASASVPVFADQNAVTAVAAVADTLDCSVDTLVLSSAGSSSGPGIVYTWSTADGHIAGGGASATPMVDQPGAYQLLVANTANGCSATDVVVVVENTAVPVLQIAAPAQLTCANPSQTLSAQNLSGPGNYTYEWLSPSGTTIVSGAQTLSPVINAPGTYTLIAHNLENGCSAQATALVDLEAGTPTAAASVAGPLTCTQLSQTLNTTGTSVGAEFSYQWTALDGGNISSGPASLAPVVDAPGQYALLVTNTQNGCTAADTVAVAENIAAPPADAGPEGLLTCHSSLFHLQANGGLSAPGLQYSWTTSDGGFLTPSDSSWVEIDVPGTYSLVVTDPANGCTAGDAVQVLANQQVPAIGIAQPATLTCTQTAVSLSANYSGGSILVYDWDSATGQFVSGENSATPVVAAPGLYTLYVVDSINGCSNTASVSVPQDTAAPQVNIAAPPVLTCALTQVTLGGSGTGNAAWSTLNGHISSGGDQFGNTIVDQPGTYTLLATDPLNGCTAQLSVAVQENIAPPAVDAGADDTLSCAINTLTVNGSGSGQGALSFAWSAGSGGQIVSGGLTASPVVDASGVYLLTVTDAFNGCSATDTVEIFTDANAPLADAGQPFTLTCSLTQANLNGSGSTGTGFTWLWTAQAGGHIAAGDDTPTPLIDAPGEYQLLVTNTANGCTSTATVLIPQNITPPTVSAGASSTLTCAVQSLALAGSATTPDAAALTFQWQTVDGNIVSGAQTPTPTVNEVGAYTLLVQNTGNGCTAQAATSVGIDTLAPALSAALPGLLTCAQTTLTLAATVQQPSSGYSVVWTTTNGSIAAGETTLSPVVELPGLYTLTVENQQNGCSSDVQVQVAQNMTPPVANVAPAGVLTCDVEQLALDAGASAGAGPLAFAWSAASGGVLLSGGNSANPSISAAGLYTVTVTNQANGCTDMASVSVSIDTLTPPTAILAPLPLTCTRDTVTINAGASIDGPGYNIGWTTPNGHFTAGQNTLFPQADQPGQYILTIENLTTGCIGTANITLNEDIQAPQAEAGPPAALDCSLPEATLQGSSPTPGAMQFAWSTTDGQLIGNTQTAQAKAGAPGTYRLLVTNPLNGCTASDLVTISEVAPPDFQPEVVQPNCLQTKGEIDFGLVAGGTPPFQYSRDGGQNFQNSPVFALVAPGNYTLVVRDAHGCTADAETELDVPVFPDLELPGLIVVPLGDEVRLMPETSLSPVQIASWAWSPADGLSCTDCPEPTALPLTNTRYTLTITDLYGCTASAPVQLRVNRQRDVYAPNIFSPNGDNVNDTFKIFGKGVVEIQSLAVFDRWGNQVYFGEHLDPLSNEGGWDGRFRGAEMTPAVFVWQAVVEFIDGAREVYAGDVTLER